MASAALPVGAPPAFGASSVQNSEWLAWPPPLLRTAVRMASGSAFRSLIRSSTLLRLQVGMRLERGVQVVDVGLVMLAVVDLHRLRVDVRLERVERVRQAGKLVRHGIHDSLLAARDRPGRAGGRATDHDGLRRDPQRPDLILTPMFRRVVLVSRPVADAGARRRPAPAQQPAVRARRSRRARRCPASRRRAAPRTSTSRSASTPSSRPRTCAPGCTGIAARPHHLGSPYGKDNAEFIAGLFRSWGYEVAITDYQVLFPTPLLRKVELVAPTKFVASLSEPPLQGRRHLQPDGRGAAAVTTSTRPTAT